MHIAVIGAGIVGVCTAAWLQRDGHHVTFIDPLDPLDPLDAGEACSLSPSDCLLVGMPGMWRRMPRWLMHPHGPLSVRWRHAPMVVPGLVRMLRHSTPAETTRIATALRGLLASIFDCYDPLVAYAGAQDLAKRTGCLYVYLSKETAAWWTWGMDLRRSLGVKTIDVGRDEPERLEPDSRGP